MPVEDNILYTLCCVLSYFNVLRENLLSNQPFQSSDETRILQSGK
jgi:hypothetical protein